MVTPLPTSARSSTRCVSPQTGFDPACTAHEVLEHATGRRGSLTLAALGDGRMRLTDLCGPGVSDPDACAAASAQDRDGAKTTLLSSCCVRAELRFGCTVDQVDRRHQRRGYGRAVVAQLERAASDGHREAALSYDPQNTLAQSLYASMGFVETGELADNEAVARRQLK